MKAKKMKRKLKSMVELKEFLKNPSPRIKVPVYTEEEVIRRTIDSGDDTVKKLTLLTISQRLDELTKIVTDGFTELRQDINGINTRLDNVEKRLDNVEARLDNVEKRLDYNGLQIEQINKRLDYNNLKHLPD